MTLQKYFDEIIEKRGEWEGYLVVFVEQKKNLEHFMLEYPEYRSIRSKDFHLQQSYIEVRSELIEKYIFHNLCMRET